MGLHPLRLVAPRGGAHPVDGLDGGVDGGGGRGLVVLVLRRLLPPPHLRGHSLAGKQQVSLLLAHGETWQHK